MSPQEVGKTNNMPYNTVGLIGKAAHEGAHVSLNALADYLRAKQCTILVEESVAQEMDGDDFTVCDLVSIGKQADLAVVVGGDGNGENCEMGGWKGSPKLCIDSSLSTASAAAIW